MRVLAATTIIFLCFNSFGSAPVLNLSQTVINPFLCSADNGEVTIFQPFEITDADGDPITIVGITSSNQSVIEDASLYAETTTATGTLNSYLYSSLGFSGAGTCVITLEVSDGTQTVFQNYLT